MQLTYIVSGTTFQLPRSTDKRVPLVSALILGDLCEYCRKSYIAEIFFGLHFIADNVGLSSTTLTYAIWLPSLPNSV